MENLVAQAGTMLGRDEERRLLTDALERPGGAVLVAGEPGIGKTTLLRWAIGRATARGATVLSCSPTLAEQDLGFAALADLLADLPDARFTDVPDVQRTALLGALRRAESREEGDGLAVSAGLAAVVRRLADDAPVLVAVDDVQWLDPASARSIAYAARRVEGAPVSFLGTLRTPLAADSVPEAWPHAGALVIQLTGLGMDDLGTLVGRAAAPTRRALQELWARTNGNPLFAEEAVAATTAPASSALGSLLRARIERLPAETQDALAMAAVAGEPDRTLVSGLLDAGAEDVLRPALADGLVEWRGDRLRFRHPLIAEAATPRSDPLRLRRVHAQLAAHDPNPERRAWHLARSTDGPAPGVAEEIATAADLAAARGAGSSAAALAREAAHLLPPGSDRAGDLLVRSAELAMLGAEWPLAADIAREAIEVAPRGAQRAKARMILWEADDESPPQGVAFFEAAGDSALQAYVLCNLGRNEWIFGRGPRRGLRLMSAAVSRARRSDDPVTLAFALSELAYLQLVCGMPSGRETLEEALALNVAVRDEYNSPEATQAMAWSWDDELDRARPVMERLIASARQAGRDDPALALTANLSNLECRAGRFDLADSYADTYAHHTSGSFPEGLVRFRRGLIAAYRGDWERASALAREGLEISAGAGDLHFGPYQHRSVLGLAAACSGDYAAVLSAVGGMADEMDARGLCNPGQILFAGDELEALIATGDLATARRRIERLEAQGSMLGQRRALGIAARARGMIAAEEGDLALAETELNRAAELHETLQDPLERGRTRMARGVVFRRAKRRGDARRDIGAALDTFQAIGATGWTERAHRELGRIGGRAASRGPDLSESERRIASLAAQGKTNVEIARTLFVTVGTVEKSLTRVYRKLGVRSRTELAGLRPGSITES